MGRPATLTPEQRQENQRRQSREGMARLRRGRADAKQEWLNTPHTCPRCKGQLNNHVYGAPAKTCFNRQCYVKHHKATGEWAHYTLAMLPVTPALHFIEFVTTPPTYAGTCATGQGYPNE